MFCFYESNSWKYSNKKDWDGPHYPWLGTKNVWKLFDKLDLIDENIFQEIQKKKKQEWTKEFSEQVYNSIKEHDCYITNLAKCTQLDARPLKDEVYKAYLKLFIKEINLVQPQKIILFGNQVSSIVLEEKIKVSQVRKKSFEKDGFEYFSVFYPVGNGSFNIDKAI